MKCKLFVYTFSYFNYVIVQVIQCLKPKIRLDVCETKDNKHTDRCQTRL